MTKKLAKIKLRPDFEDEEDNGERSWWNYRLVTWMQDRVQLKMPPVRCWAITEVYYKKIPGKRKLELSWVDPVDNARSVLMSDTRSDLLGEYKDIAKAFKQPVLNLDKLKEEYNK